MNWLRSTSLWKWLGYAGVISLALVAIFWVSFVPREKQAGYVFVTSWGGPGSQPGQFSDPTGIAVSGGEVFVADARNGRIQVFDLDGNFLRAFGEPGDGPGELGRPMNLTVHQGELYVPEYFNDRVQIFDLQGNSRRIMGSQGTGPGQLSAPGGVAIDDEGALYVAGFANHRVQKLTPGGELLRQWGTIGKPGIGAGDFSYPTDVAFHPDGRIFVSDGYNDRVQAFSSDGEFLTKWGGPFAINIFGPFHGWFSVATSIGVGPEGNVFVADFYNDRVQKFAPNGTFLTAFGQTGEGLGEFRHAMAIAVAEDGSVFVTDFLNNRVHKWAPPD